LEILELYHNHISVCAQKVRLVLAEKGLSWKGHHFDLRRGEHLNPDYLKLNPKGVVPTLIHDGTVLVESTAINEYLDEVFPEPPLKPKDPVGRARMRVWTKLVDEGIHPATTTITFATTFRGMMLQKTPQELEDHLRRMPDLEKRELQRQLIDKGVDSPLVVKAIKLYDKTFDAMEKALAERLWLVGDSYSLADVAYTPYLTRFDDLGMAEMWEVSRPRLGDWFARIKKRPNYATAISDIVPEDYLAKLKAGGSAAWPRIKAILKPV
jgi:glutathione S-transferase